MFLSEIIGLVIFVVAVILGIAAAYLVIRHWHRKWYWEDEDRKAIMLRQAMHEAGISYTVDDSGGVRPLGTREPRTSGRARP